MHNSEDITEATTPEELDETTKIEELEDSELYDEMAQEDNLRPADEGNGKSKGVTESEDDATLHSDLKVATDKLFPEGLGDKITNHLMIGRISPDAFVPLLRMMTKAEISRSEPDEEINVPAIMAKNYILLSVGLDGKGRIDVLELAGATKDEKELEKLGKSLGF